MEPVDRNMTQYQVRNLAENAGKKGRYLMDYSRKYHTPYDVAEKAGQHVKSIKKEQENRGQDLCVSPRRRTANSTEKREDMLETGIKGHQEMTVTEEFTAKSMGSGVMDVFATPAMLALMEKTAFTSVAEYLNEGCGTVGIKVDIEHLASSPLGMKITCDSELTAIEGRKLVFSVEAYDEKGLIGKGTHERFIIESQKFQEKTDRKLEK